MKSLRFYPKIIELKSKPFFLLSLKLVLLCGIFFVLLTKLDFKTVGHYLLATNSWYLAVLLPVYLAAVALSSLRWKLVLEAMSFKVTFFELLKLYLIGGLLSLVLPSTVGGDAIKVRWMFKTFKTRKIVASSSVVIERLVGYIAIYIWTIIIGGAILIQTELSGLKTIYWFLVFAGLGGALAMVVFRYFLTGTLIKKVKYLRFLQNKHLNFVQKKLVVISFAVSLVRVMVSIISAGVMFLAFSQSPDWGLLSLSLPLISLVGALPISFNNFGIQEGIGVYIFTQSGYQAEMVFSVFFLLSVVHSVFALGLGGLALIGQKKV